MRKKKAGPTARFGARYGLKIRRRVLEIEKKLKEKKTCPVCGKLGIKREASGIWVCKRCGAKIAGGAYSLR